MILNIFLKNQALKVEFREILNRFFEGPVTGLKIGFFRNLKYGFNGPIAGILRDFK